MVYQGRIETNLLQLLAQQENSEWFSLFLLLFCGFKIVAEQKQKYR